MEEIISQKNGSDNQYDFVVVGTGFAGAVAARELAERGNKKVLLLEKRNHAGGNAYDCPDSEGILIHKYGPHIFHTNNRRVFDYLSRFTSWREYKHKVLANICNKLMPVPFNLESLRIAFGKKKASRLQNTLIANYGRETKIGILELKKNSNPEIRELAEYVYQNIFLYYTQKQWGTKPEDIDPSVTARVPVFISEDDRYFQDLYQGMPLNGYTALFEKMLDHSNITLQFNTDTKNILQLENGKIYLNRKPFDGALIYTGAIDELFDFRLGHLHYRTLDFVFETHNTEWFQSCGTINYTVDQPYTRITEFKHLTGQINKLKTTTMKEYSLEYHGDKDEIPYYPVVNPESSQLYNQYLQIIKEFPQIHLVGRLAEFKYYNMDAVIEKALALAEKLI